MAPLATSNDPFMSLTYDTCVISEVITEVVVGVDHNSRETSPTFPTLFVQYCGFPYVPFQFILGSLSNDDDDGDGNENGKKGMDKISKTTTLHLHHAFLYIS